MSGATNTSTLPEKVGCFDSSFPLIDQGYYKYQSSGYCNVLCRNISKAVLGLSQGNQCWCGDDLPPIDSLVSNSQCNQPCQGYDLEDCGGNGNILTVWLTGLNLDAPNYVPQGSSSTATSSATRSSNSQTSRSDTALAAASSTHPASSTTASLSSTSAAAVGAQSSASAVAPAQTHHHHTDVLAIVLGTVLGGCFAVALLIGLLWFLWRRRKQRSAKYIQADSQSQPRDSVGSVYSQNVDAAGTSPMADEKLAGMNGHIGPRPLISAPMTPVADEKQDTGGSGDTSPRPMSTVAPLPPLRPPFRGGTTLRGSRQSSVTTSSDQPFYTPSEGPRSFIGSEPPEHALQDGDKAEMPQEVTETAGPARGTYLAYETSPETDEPDYNLPAAVQTHDHRSEQPHTSIPAELEANTRTEPAPPIADQPPVLPPIGALHQSEFFPNNRESNSSFTAGQNDPFRSPNFAGTGFVPMDTMGRRSVSLSSSRDSDDTDYHAR